MGAADACCACACWPCPALRLPAGRQGPSHPIHSVTRAPPAGVIEFDGSYVNYRHLAALVDSMTSRWGPEGVARGAVVTGS